MPSPPAISPRSGAAACHWTNRLRRRAPPPMSSSRWSAPGCRGVISLHEPTFRFARARTRPSGRIGARRPAPRRHGGDGRRAAGGADADRHARHAVGEDPGPAGRRRAAVARSGAHRAPVPLRANRAEALMRRAAIIVIDGLGFGAALDADAYGDAGSNTL